MVLNNIKPNNGWVNLASEYTFVGKLAHCYIHRLSMNLMVAGGRDLIAAYGANIKMTETNVAFTCLIV